MNKDNFLKHTLNVIYAAKKIDDLSKILEYDIQCNSFIGELLYGYTSLITEEAFSDSCEEHESFLGLVEKIMNKKENTISSILKFYNERKNNNG